MPVVQVTVSKFSGLNSINDRARKREPLTIAEMQTWRCIACRGPLPDDPGRPGHKARYMFCSDECREEARAALRARRR